MTNIFGTNLGSIMCIFGGQSVSQCQSMERSLYEIEK